MAKKYDSSSSLQEKILKGVDVLADNVASTLGPKGRNVLLKEIDKQPFITKDGVTVAAFVALEDPFENAGAQILRQAAIDPNVQPHVDELLGFVPRARERVHDAC